MFHESGGCRRSFSLPGRNCAPILFIIALFPIACASKREQIAQSLGNSTPAPVIREQTVEESYRVACPDVIEVKVAGMPESGRYAIDPDGRVSIAALGNPRVEGQTVVGLAGFIAGELHLPAEKVKCQVIEHRSRVVFVRGQMDGGDRAVPYRGAENVVSFIRRCGGLKQGADVRDIHVVRSNLDRGEKPQVFTVDLEAILLRGEPQTNVLMQPFDELFVGELARSKIGEAMPGWLRPVYRGFCNIFPSFCPSDWRGQFRDPEP
jgi:protein involved in polysaccharide export with SLBB domain